MQKAKKLIKKQPIDVKFNLIRALDEDIKETVLNHNLACLPNSTSFRGFTVKKRNKTH